MCYFFKKELSGRNNMKPSKSLYISDTNQGNNITPNEFQKLISHQNNLKNKILNSYKNKLNQSVNEGFSYNPHAYHNLYSAANNLNKSMTIDNEIQELDEPEDENNVNLLKYDYYIYVYYSLERNL